MADVKVRNLDDDVVATLRRHAEAAGCSLEEELRRIISEECRRRREALASDILAHQTAARARHGELSDSTGGIRADRNARG